MQKVRKTKKLNFLYVSIIAHILLGLIAAYIIVQVITPRPKPKFIAAPPSKVAVHPDEQKQQNTKRESTMSAPPTQRITTNAQTKIMLPSIPNVPMIQSDQMGAGESMDTGFGAGIGTGTGPGGGGVSAFGLRNGDGLKGTFYDFKQTKDGKPTGMSGGYKDARAQVRFAQLVVQFSRTFDDQLFAPYFHAPDALYAPYIFYPYMLSGEAPKAFDVPSKPAMWCIVYKGTVIPPASGTYYFVGFGDDVCIVRFNGTTVLDHGSFSWKTAPGGRAARNMDNTTWNPTNKAFKTYLYETLDRADKGFYEPMHGHLRGNPVTVIAGMSYPIEIVVGDWGGATLAQVLLEKEGIEYQKDARGNPILPIFSVSNGNTVKLPQVPEDKVPPFDHNPPAWSIWKLNPQSLFP